MAGFAARLMCLGLLSSCGHLTYTGLTDFEDKIQTQHPLGSNSQDLSDHLRKLGFKTNTVRPQTDNCLVRSYDFPLYFATIWREICYSSSPAGTLTNIEIKEVGAGL